MSVAKGQDDNLDDGRDDVGDDAPGDDRDENLTDDDLESEIELVSELVVAATSSDGPLHQDVVDQILGLDPKGEQPQQHGG